MTDPLISRGNMFTCKGSQNHMISDMWKDNVKREQRAARRWAKKYLTEHSQSDALLAPTATEQLPSQAVRLPAVKAVYRTASSELSSCSFRPSSKQVLDRDLSLRFPNCGHKPIVATSFFRTNGVFSSGH
jgi:hypothetical protein